MNKNLKMIFLLTTIVFLLVSITAISAQDTNQNDTGVKKTTDVTATKVAQTKNVDTVSKNIVKEDKSKATTKKASTHIVNNDNVDEIFGGANHTLADNISAGDTLDFQGTIDKNHSLVINKPIRTMSSTKDAVISLHTVAGSLMGEDPGNSFVINKGASGSFISELYLFNTECWVHNLYNATLYNMTMHVENARVGSGVGQTSLRYSNNVTMDSCHIYTENNGGSSSFVWTGCNNCTIVNSTVEGVGGVGNLLYVGNGFNTGDKPADYVITNFDNNVINCTIIGGSGGISNPLQNGATRTLIKGNKFYSGGSASSGTNGTFIDNEFYRTVSVSMTANCIAHGNVHYGTGSASVAASTQVYNNTFNAVTISGANVLFENNTIKGHLTVNQPTNIENNNLNTVGLTGTNSKGSNVTNNIITGGLTSTVANITISDNIFNSSVNETVLTITGAGNVVKDNEIYAKSTTGTAAIKVSDNTVLENNTPEMAEAIIITDDTYTNFFDENSYINTNKVANYGTIVLTGPFNNKVFKFKDIILNVNSNESVINNGYVQIDEGARISLENLTFINNGTIENSILINTDANTIRNVNITKTFSDNVNAREIRVNGNNNIIELNTISITGPSQGINYNVTPSLSPIIGILVMGSSNTVQNNVVNFNDTASSNFGSTDFITVTGVLKEAKSNIVTRNNLTGTGKGYLYAINLGVDANSNQVTYNNINLNSTDYAYGVQMLQAPVYGNTITYNNINLTAANTAYGVFTNPWALVGNAEVKDYAINYNNMKIEAERGFGIQFAAGSYGDIVLRNINATYNNINVTGKYALGIGIAKFDTGYLYRNYINVKGETNETDTSSWDNIQPRTVGVYMENGNYIRASYQFINAENGSAIIYKDVTGSTIQYGSLESNNMVVVLENSSRVNVTSNTINSSSDYGVSLVNSESNRVASNTFNSPSDKTGDNQVLVDEESKNNAISGNYPQGSNLTFVTTTANIDETLTVQVRITTSTGSTIRSGIVVFTDEKGNVLGNASISSGTARYVYGNVTTFDSIVLNAQYVGSTDYKPSPVVKQTINVTGTPKIVPGSTNLKIEDTTNLTAYITDNGAVVTEGKAIFRINGKTLRDENGDIIYVDVVNGMATLPDVNVTSEWTKPGTTIQAIYTGNENFNPVITEPVPVNVTKREAKLEITSSLEAKVGETITLSVNVTDGENKVNAGRVVFKLNGKTLKGEDGKALYVDVVNGVATVTYTIPAKTKAKDYTLSAVFTDSNYSRCETEETITISK